MSKYYTITEVSESLGICKTTLRKLVREGKLLPEGKVAYRQLVFSNDSIKSMLALNELNTVKQIEAINLDTKYYDTKEVAEIIGFTASTVVNYEKKGLVPDFYTLTGLRRYSERTISSFIDTISKKGE